MRKNFLIGNFLPAYGSSFGRIERKRGVVPGLTPEELEKRFAQRNLDRKRQRTRYMIILQIGMVAALSTSIVAFRLDFQPAEREGFNLIDQEVVQMEEIVQTEQVQKPPPPPRPPVPVEVPDDMVLENEDIEFDALLDINEAITDVPPPPPAIIVEEETEPEIFMIVENPPEMVGGFQALAKELKYPEIARRAGIDGTVVVQIIVGEDGNPREPKIIRPIQESLDNEAIRAVMLQKFTPGRQRGRAVPVYMNIPVIFRLN